MLRWCYTQEYQDSVEPPRSPSDSLSAAVIDAHLYALAEKYSIQGLKDCTSVRFQIRLEWVWDVFESGALLAKDLTSVIEIAYSTTPASDRKLRDVILYCLQPINFCTGIKTLTTFSSQASPIVSLPSTSCSVGETLTKAAIIFVTTAIHLMVPTHLMVRNVLHIEKRSIAMIVVWY